MQSSERRRAGRSRVAAASGLAALLVLPMQAAPKQPQPIARLTLESLGIPVVSQNFLDAGVSMLSVHFVDAGHALVTYGLRGLVERIPGDPPDDDDRAVGAMLMELPSGKVLARTRWHLHDHAQYLWSLGGGRFLLRDRSTLTAIAPLANLASGEAFRQMPFVHVAGQIDLVLVSPEGDLVTLESSAVPERVREANGQPQERRRRGPETFAFLRVVGDGSAGAPVRAVSAGRLRAAAMGTLPLNARGYLVAKEKGRNHWVVDFESFDGGTKTLEYLESSCAPTLQFVSPGQYVAFSCRGADDRIMVSAFDFAPHEIWEELLGGTTSVPQFAYSPETGRFAMSRMVSAVTVTPGTGGPALAGVAPPLGDATTTQEVRIYQTQSGDLLLKVACTPVLRAGQNFDLAPDGVGFMVVRNAAIEVYKLPGLSGRDRKELAEAKGFEPAMAKATQVEFRRVMREAAAEAVETEAVVAEAAAPVATAPVEAGTKAEVGKAVEVAVPVEPRHIENGDDQSERKGAPSLLKPGETAEGGKPAKKKESAPR